MRVVGFETLAIGARFEWGGLVYRKLALSMCADEHGIGYIFQDGAQVLALDDLAVRKTDYEAESP